MKIAIISDIHDNAHNLVMFYEQIKNQNIEKILFLWDYCWWGIWVLLANSPIPVFAIWWNNDWDKSLITKFALKESSNLEVWFDTFDSIEINNRKIFLSHYPMIAKPIAKSWDYDAVFYWHNHIKHKELINDCLVLNPWEVWAYKTWEWTYAIYDTNSNTAEIIEIKDSITTNTNKSQERFKELKFEFSKQKWHKLD